MKIEPKKTRGDMTPMIDCVFLLLIFFVVAAKFVSPEGIKRVWMPKDEGGPGPAIDMPEDTRIVLRGGKDKNISLFVDKVGIAEFNKDLRQWKLDKEVDKFEGEMKRVQAAFTGPQGLDKKILKLKRAGAINKVLIDAGPEVPYLFVIQAIEACQRAEILTLKFAGSKNKLRDQHDGLIKMN
jgi:biopolymer transport protein ExbD